MKSNSMKMYGSNIFLIWIFENLFFLFFFFL